jgi:hypothetical protein
VGGLTGVVGALLVEVAHRLTGRPEAAEAGVVAGRSS